MNAVVPIRASDAFSGSQLALIKSTVAADCNAQEFDLFVTVARNAGLDPFRKQISALVFNKNKPDKRRMAIVTTIDGLRVIASRSGRYRPDEEEARYEYDADLKSQPAQLRMNAYATNGGIDKRRFEMFALSASIVGKCHFCVKSHFALLQKEGMSSQQLRDVGRIAAVVNAAAQAIAASA